MKISTASTQQEKAIIILCCVGPVGGRSVQVQRDDQRVNKQSPPHISNQSLLFNTRDGAVTNCSFGLNTMCRRSQRLKLREGVKTEAPRRSQRLKLREGVNRLKLAKESKTEAPRRSQRLKLREGVTTLHWTLNGGKSEE
ncbi:hypothetical protein GBF38_014682 [Nibea albiflora]|uniref:Uncharacterized protein n=1 Tax=Nibea albiflora TaxID=240163 RepID=A0ACB7F4N6_NIBAL|nr:hypothetical protein GBF38_014682 [Nibea albiflora]